MSDVRLATAADVPGIYDMITQEMWAENAAFPFDEQKVRAFLAAAVAPVEQRQANTPLAIIGVVGEPDALKASVALCVVAQWYTEHYHVEEFWNFVRPAYRKGTGYALQQLDFCKDIQKQMGLPMVVGVFSPVRTAAKIRLYERHLGKPVGAYFAWPSLAELHKQIMAA